MDAKQLGVWGEDQAVFYLERNGYAIELRNYHTVFGEIDIVAQRNNLLSFVEVKTRRTDAFGGADNAFGERKRARFLKAVYSYLQKKNILFEFQIDFIAITVLDKKAKIRHYKNCSFSVSE